MTPTEPSSSSAETVTISREEYERLRALEAVNRDIYEQLRVAQAENSELREQVRVLLERLTQVERDHAELLKRVTGRTSEKKKTSSRNVTNPRANNDAAAQKKRKANRDRQNNNVPTQDVEHPLTDEQRAECPSCGCPDIRPMGADPASSEWVYVPGRLVRRRHHRHKGCCARCGEIVRAPAPERVYDGAKYDAGFMAETVVRKVVDAMPLHRQAKAWLREGCPIARSTLNDLFHRAAALLTPIYDQLLVLVLASYVVYADETSLKMQKVPKTGFVWTFACEDAIVYTYAADRSGETPVRVLGQRNEGLLVVDGYSGYNSICTPEGWLRGGCNAHGRRKFVDIDDALAELIITTYEVVWDVERDAKAGGFAGTDRHLEMRRDRAGPAMRQIKAWCDDNVDRYLPKEPMGKAIGYIRNQWEFLTRFLEHIEIAPDNNWSERLLRTIALGRKNFLFVGHEGAGQNLAILASLAMTCIHHDVNPWQYLTDVLMRVQTHPARDIGMLVPHRWKLHFGPLYDV